MRNRSYAVAGLFALGLAAMAGVPGVAGAQTNLRFNNWLPPGHPFNVDVLKPWAEAATKATGGRVGIEFTGSSLAPPPRQFDLVASRGADLAFSVAGYNTDRLPLTGVLAVPFIGNSGEATSVVFWQVYKKHFEKADEFRGVKLLGAFALPSGQIFAKRPVVKVDDFKGLKVRVGSATLSRMMEAVGAVPVFAPATRSYEMMSNGVTEAGGYDFSSIVDFKIASFVPHVTVVPGGVVNDVFYVMVNPDSWAALSASDRAAIESVSQEKFAQASGAAVDRNNLAAREDLLKGGMKEHAATPELVAELRRRFAFAEEEWVRLAATKGVDGPAALAELRDGIAAYEARMKKP
jgi:TRAP-type C4-dicarboxylate transport system substrate-binding protein